MRLVGRRQHGPHPQRRGPVPLGGAQHPRRGPVRDGQCDTERGELGDLAGHEHAQLGGAEQGPVPFGGVQPG